MRNILAAHTNCYYGYPLRIALEGIASAGFRYVELGVGRGKHAHVAIEYTWESLRELQALLDEYGLIPGSVSGHSDLTTAQGLEDAKRAVDFCAALGVTIMNTSVGGTHSEAEDKAAFMRHIFQLADYAEERGVTLALEIHGDLMATGARAVAIIREIARANVRINYDTANCMYYGGVKAEDDIVAAAPYLAHVHLKDSGGGPREWNFPPIGQGAGFRRALRILEDGGDGPLSVEIEFYGTLPAAGRDQCRRPRAYAYLEPSPQRHQDTKIDRSRQTLRRRSRCFWCSW
jgi:sugar phosphate isomerase/epimerase